MAKKRKLDSKSPATTQIQQKQRLKQQLEEQQKQQQQQQQQLEEEQMAEAEADEEDPEYEEVEGDVDEEEEDEVEEEDEDDDGEEQHKKTANYTSGGSVSAGHSADDDDEPISKLLEPFSKDQLINLLREAAESHYDIAVRIRQIADEDPVHRKIFVHGLGWDTTADTLRSAFGQYGEIEDCKAVTDKVSGKSKGYGFILFKTRSGARKALKQPQKKIGNRMTACQLAAVGPVPSSAGAATGQAAQQQPVSEYTQRKIYVSNVSTELDPQKLTSFFAKFGEIEEGPLGLDKQTGKPKGFCLFVYKSIEGARKALEEPHKNFEGHILHCQKAIDGPKPGKQQQQGQQRNPHYGRNENPNLAGAIGGAPATGAGHLMGQSVAGIPFNQGAAAAAQALNPAIGQALTALLASQGAGLGLSNLLGTLGTAGVGAAAVNPAVAGAGHGLQGAYASQAMGSTGVLGGYGAQAGLQGAYPNQQIGQGGSGRAQHGVGHIGGVAPYTGLSQLLKLSSCYSHTTGSGGSL
ncbi:UBP1-associated protein 2A [Ancistrocladus abbreviatus]